MTWNNYHDMSAEYLCTWYPCWYPLYHPHPHGLYLSCFDDLGCESPRPKRRKIETFSMDNNMTRITSRSRGKDVIFKPYSDNLSAVDQQKILLAEQNCKKKPQKRKLREIQDQEGFVAKGFADRRLLLLSKHKETRLSLLKKKGHYCGEESEGKVVEGATETTISDIFPEVLSIIFSYLDTQSKGRAARVCRAWKMAIYRKSVWKGMEAQIHLVGNNSDLYPSLVRRGINKVQVLSLKRTMRELINKMPNLERLILSGCFSLSDSTLDSAFNHSLPRLKSLNLSLCKELSDSSLGRIATHCKNLEEIDLAGCTKITNMGLLFIALGLKNIKKLNLRSCRQISDFGIAHLCGIKDQSVGDEEALGLTDLCLQDCQKLSDDCLKYISVGLPHLKSINLSFCSSITDSGLKMLAKLQKLSNINLRSCDNVSDIGISYLSEERGLSIEDLDLSFCSNLTDVSLKHVAMGMPNLKSLSLTTCCVTDQGLNQIVERVGGLHYLNVGQCYGITDISVRLIADKLQELKALDIYGCSKVTKESLQKVRKLPKLQVLKMEL